MDAAVLGEQEELPSLDVTTSDFREHSVQTLAALCRAAPLCRLLPMGILGATRFRDCDAILHDHHTFSSHVPMLPAPGRAPAGAMVRDLPLLGDDPPRHTRLRQLAGQAFTPPRIAAMEPRIVALSRRLLDDITDRGETFDLVADLAAPLPVVVIAELLGVDPADRSRFHHWSDDLVAANMARYIPDQMARDARLAAIEASVREMESYFEEVIEARRAVPQRDIVSTLVAATQGSDQLTAEEVVGLCKLLLVAGNETTTKLIGLATNLLLQHPPQLRRLLDDPSLIPPALEETLRLEGPVPLVGRLAMVGTSIAGRPIPAQTVVAAVVGAANLDPEVFDQPEAFDISRVIPRHLAFGTGLHACLGAPLARLEARVAFEEMSARMQELEPTAPPRRVVAGLRGFSEMRLRYRLRDRRLPGSEPRVIAEVATAAKVAAESDHELGLDKRAIAIVRVSHVREIAEGIKLFRLVHPSGGTLVRFTAGSHIVVHMREGALTHRNAYSLLNTSIGEGLQYFIAVALAHDSKGGSRYMHDEVRPGMELTISVPANNFPTTPPGVAGKHLLVAGGIGITPLVALRNELRLRGEVCELHYAFKRAAAAAFVDLLEMDFDPNVHLYDGHEGQRLDVDALLRRQPCGTHLYVCGPERMMTPAIEGALTLGWPSDTIHFERFGAPRAADEPPFEAFCARSRRTLRVSGAQTLLEALEDAGLPVPYECRAGSCGTCEVRVLEGAIDHRDTCLTVEERANGDRMMACVSRARGLIVLDL